MNTKESVKELLLAVNNETTNQWEEITKDKSLEFFQKWLIAQETMMKRYNIVNDILNVLREKGWDVKIDMQNYYLSFHGRI